MMSKSSAVYNRNSNGPRTEPCGMPKVMHNEFCLSRLRIYTAMNVDRVKTRNPRKSKSVILVMSVEPHWPTSVINESTWKAQSPDMDHFRNLTGIFLFKDTSVLKFSRRFDKFFSRDMSQTVEKCHILQYRRRLQKFLDQGQMRKTLKICPFSSDTDLLFQ